jgi:hypothetical protein
VSTTLEAVCEDFLVREGGMTRDAEGVATFDPNRELRSSPERLAVFERLLYPETLANEQIANVKRSQVNKLLDKIKDQRGARSAQQLLAFLSRVFS